MGGSLTKVDIGSGRGWLAPEPAASLRRIDAQLGRLADINEAGRSPEQANANRARWLAYERYLNGGPWAPKAPYALGADESVHCWGYAADTDDSYNATASAVWLENGWVQTAIYPNNPNKHEPWHREYRKDRDKHRTSGGAAGSEDDMSEKAERQIQQIYNAMFTGGPSMTENGNAVQASLAKIWNAVKPIRRDGKDVALRQEIADIKTTVYAQNAAILGMEAAIKALATSKGFDPAAILKAAQEGVEQGLRGVTFTANIDG